MASPAGYSRAGTGPAHTGLAGGLSDGAAATQVSHEEARQLVDCLAAQTLIGRAIVTWNGMDFDGSENSGGYEPPRNANGAW